ncbi:cytochrome P450 [Cryphonectria parasitica EP155]|uniref:Cytochrome P450 n=1 Tax=Cryphonectria parasitica (strain ATCC 38755 / EP155) TaxID=660469 RepID=A0A9P4Y613_CRYP1|nr:cytochrome P450 [Cryphonectria parasitica EP155]KAF3767619.1 cytochrome P450 [Cryphonectria parasitica EP155]
MYGPVPVTPRWTAHDFHTLTIDGKEYTIPPDTSVKIDLVSLHHDKKTWGDDADEFRPDRWIPSTSSSSLTQAASSSTTRSSIGTYDWQSESLISTAAGTFLPWTGGPRVCPGKKFSQVEFTSVLLRLFQGGARVRIAEEEGESSAQARARARRIAGDPDHSITLRMKGSKEIGLKWYVKEN